jgi:hypothetical protein
MTINMPSKFINPIHTHLNIDPRMNANHRTWATVNPIAKMITI